MKLKRIKSLSFYGLSTLIAAFTLSLLVLITSLFNYEAARQEGRLFLEAYNALLRLKDDSQSLLTSHDLQRDRIHWQQSTQIFERKLRYLEGRQLERDAISVREIQRLWRITRDKIHDIDQQLENSAFLPRHTLNNPLLRRVGEAFTREGSSQLYLSLQTMSNALGYLTQYEDFLLEEFQTLLVRQSQEENARLRNIKFIAVILPIFILLASIALSILLARWMNQVEAQLLEKEQALSRLNTDLQNEAHRQLRELRRKDELLVRQSRLAAMGEMIGNIAHQWRQPLNTLAILVQDALDAEEAGELDHEYLQDVVNRSMKLMHKMSGTIDDFRNFFSPNKQRDYFMVSEAVERALSIIDAALYNNNIQVEKRLIRDTRLLGYVNEYEQVILNILSNAKDALVKNTPPRERRITLEINQTRAGHSRLVIADTGGGIGEEIMDRIFEPYFTTKFQAEGTGIGLYMSKMIIENNMGGCIRARNIKNGAEFEVEV